MRVLFVSGTSIGGAARSTLELAEVLASRGHAVAVLLRDDGAERTTARHKRLLNARVKLERRRAPDAVVSVATWAHRSVGRQRAQLAGSGGARVWRTPLPENALARALGEHRPDVVVVNSIERPAWRQIRADLAERAIPSVLYLREATGVRHLVEPPSPPDLLLANAGAHADAARAAGYDCTVVPSVVHLDRCVVESTRSHALVVNPIRLYGVDRALDLADARPDVPFVFQESWPIPDDEVDGLRAAVARRENIELRPPRTQPRAVYRDARTLLMLCTVPSRPRVIAEAQANGIPVLATALPGHDEAVGPGGLLVAPDAPLPDWLSAFDRVWRDGPEYHALSRGARAHAARVSMHPDVVTERFEQLLAGAITRVSATH